MSGADVVAIIALCGGVVSAIGGVVLAVRAARSKERQANRDEIDQLTEMLTTERHERIAAELDLHHAKLRLAEHGIDPDDG